MKPLFKRFSLALTGLVTVAGMSVPAVAQSADTLRIGTFLAATGPAAFLGDPELKTLRLYVDQINEKGGVLNKKIELVAYDSGGDASKALSFATRLVREDKVDFIVGGSTTGETMAVVPIVEQARVPFISLSGAEVVTSPVKKWVFKTPQSDRQAAQRILKDMKDRGFTKIGLVSGTGGFGASGRNVTLEEAPNFGVEVIADETYNPKDTDVTAQLTRVSKTDGVQAILDFDFGSGPAIVTKNYRQLGIKLPFYQSHGVASDSFLDLAGDAANGVYLPSPAVLVADAISKDDPQYEVANRYKAEYEAKYGESVSTFGGYAFDGLHILVQAINDAGTTDRAKVRDALEKVEYIGVTGHYRLSADDHMGLDADSFRMLVVKDGSWALAE